MPLSLYNTLTGKKEPFEPIDPSRARVYVCGPTVYDYAHLGHARCYVIYDVLVRHLRASGQKLTYVRNVTDIDDKILKRAGEAGEHPMELARRFETHYQQDMRTLGNLDPDVEPRVSEHLDEIRALIQRLIDQGAAYVSEHDVYFDVAKFAGYGKLSHRKLDQMELGASGRTDEDEVRRKKHPADFALWKGTSDGSLTWPSPWGDGRPGWHIECSAMSMKHLGETLDLHGGGLDLVFPHHENEVAQSEAATGKPFSRCWMHNGFVEVDKEKMSKSLGNFFTARELFQRVEPEAVRYVMMTMHYRAPLNLEWTLDDAGKVTGFPQFEEAERRVEYLYSTRERLESIPAERVTGVPDKPAKEVAELEARMTKALDDDLNMPIAIAAIADFLKAVNLLCDRATKKKSPVGREAFDAACAGFTRISKVLGLGTADPKEMLLRIRDRRAKLKGVTSEMVQGKIAARSSARDAKDFARADAIRTELATLGVELLDREGYTDWRML